MPHKRKKLKLISFAYVENMKKNKDRQKIFDELLKKQYDEQHLEFEKFIAENNLRRKGEDDE